MQAVVEARLAGERRCSTGRADAKRFGLRALPRILSIVTLLSLASLASALEVRVFVGSCLPTSLCSWEVKIGADRKLSLSVDPQAHQSKQFFLSRKEFAQLESLLRREDFFSLPEELGALVADGPQATLEVRDGKRIRTVALFSLPYEFKPIWRTDAGPTGRAFRVCEHVRAVAKVESLLNCPGVPNAKNEE